MDFLHRNLPTETRGCSQKRVSMKAAALFWPPASRVISCSPPLALRVLPSSRGTAYASEGSRRRLAGEHRAEGRSPLLAKRCASTAAGIQQICVAAEEPLEASHWGALQWRKADKSLIWGSVHPCLRLVPPGLHRRGLGRGYSLMR